MDGVIMMKFLKLFVCMALLAQCYGFGGLLADKQQLKDDLIRLHVIANSDSEEDQALKLRVRDAVVSYLTPLTQNLSGKEEAMSVLYDNLAAIQEVASQVLEIAGTPYNADVSLTQEKYGKRVYDSFSLPSGIYDSLQIKIGTAEGKNWWCVVFPSLCLSAAPEDFGYIAAGAGFDDTLVSTLTGEKEYELRFFLLDCIGKIENLFH